MQLNELTAISPIDGRYRKATADLAEYLSEFGLIKYRVRVEIEYFVMLCKTVPQLSNINISDIYPVLKAVYENFSEKDALEIKATEKITNHDVKAVEYFV
ncbi:MAG: adenylosuccinate lyase, partial [Bacteroidia bacterium]